MPHIEKAKKQALAFILIRVFCGDIYFVEQRTPFMLDTQKRTQFFQTKARKKRNTNNQRADRDPQRITHIADRHDESEKMSI